MAGRTGSPPHSLISKWATPPHADKNNVALDPQLLHKHVARRTWFAFGLWLLTTTCVIIVAIIVAIIAIIVIMMLMSIVKTIMIGMMMMTMMTTMTTEQISMLRSCPTLDGEASVAREKAQTMVMAMTMTTTTTMNNIHVT